MITEPLTEAEAAWIEDQLDLAGVLVRRAVGRAVPLTPLALDRALHALPPQGSEAALRALGVAFGQVLVDALGLSWVAVAQEEGFTVGVVLEDAATLLVLPEDVVARCRARGDDLDDAFRDLRRDLARFRTGD